MSLRYTPGFARSGMTSSRETRAALPGAICTASPANWIQDGGTARPEPRLSRSTRMLTASASDPVLTTSRGSANFSPRCAMLPRRTGLTCTPTPTLASDAWVKPASATRATGTASGTASNRHRCISTPPVLHLFHIITGQTRLVNRSVPYLCKRCGNADQDGLHNVAAEMSSPNDAQVWTAQPFSGQVPQKCCGLLNGMGIALRATGPWRRPFVMARRFAPPRRRAGFRSVRDAGHP